MKKSELFNAIVEEVANVCEVPLNDIIHGGRTQSEVEARCLVVHWSQFYGLSVKDLLLFFNKKHVNSIVSAVCSYDCKLKQSFFFRQANNDVCQCIAKRLRVRCNVNCQKPCKGNCNKK